jgi:hypothetical protein
MVGSTIDVVQPPMLQTAGDGWYRFKGAMGSLGLVTGNRYQLVLHQYPEGNLSAEILLAITAVHIKQVPLPILPVITCPYDSLSLFYKNWERA